MAVVLDAGAFVAYDRGSHRVAGLLEDARRNGTSVRTSSAVVAQVWRDGARQARLAQLLRGVDERSLDPVAARRIGRVLARSKTVDVVDAALMEIAVTGDEVLTSDPDDVATLADAAGKRVSIIRI